MERLLLFFIVLCVGDCGRCRTVVLRINDIVFCEGLLWYYIRHCIYDKKNENDSTGKDDGHPPYYGTYQIIIHSTYLRGRL